MRQLGSFLETVGYGLLKKSNDFFPPNSTVVYVRFTGDLVSLGIVNPAL